VAGSAAGRPSSSPFPSTLAIKLEDGEDPGRPPHIDALVRKTKADRPRAVPSVLAEVSHIS
jgi:hypothetical protein